ncbi:MAG: DNA methyltransferase [Melioribacter sp.]|nr:DNA methyltransferase [Melioribacter sp.]
MNNKRLHCNELELAIINEKLKGTTEIEIGKKYGVSSKYIEKVITKIKGLNVSSINNNKKIKTYSPKNFSEEQSSVWSFKQRGNWATHSGEYRGNWSPYIPRNIILKYSREGDLVLDYFCGAGTTAVECKLLGRRCIAMVINENAIQLAKKNLDFVVEPQQTLFDHESKTEKFYEPKLLVGDARNLSFLEDNSVDLICAHPPYANIIHYTHFKEGDLSLLSIDEFLTEMYKVAKESFRVLKPYSKCAILIGDTRKKKHIVPLGFKLINVFLKAGFLLKELIIKRQHNCKTTGFWYDNSIKYNFLLLAHEYLPIFEKPGSNTLTYVKEAPLNYNLFSAKEEKLKLKKDLNKLETTTVWVFPEKDSDELVDKNVIFRYSNGNNYLIVKTNSSKANELSMQIKKSVNKNELLYVKLPEEGFNSLLDIENYLITLKDIINKLSNLIEEGFLVLKARDFRINGYIVPLALKIIENIDHTKLWLKEIIIVVPENNNVDIKKIHNELEIIHQYLLVYEVR